MSKFLHILTTSISLIPALTLGCGPDPSSSSSGNGQDTQEQQADQTASDTDEQPAADAGAGALTGGSVTTESPDAGVGPAPTDGGGPGDSNVHDGDTANPDLDAGPPPGQASQEIIDDAGDITPDVLTGVGETGELPDNDGVPFEDSSVPFDEVDPSTTPEESEPLPPADPEEVPEEPVVINPDLPALRSLGKYVFFDSISEPSGMACVTCHDPTEGWTHPDSEINQGLVAAPGAAADRFGVRKPPAVAYASFSPVFGDANPGGTSCTGSTSVGGPACRGGLMWDGRATGGLVGPGVFAGNEALQSAYGEFLGPVADQVLGPFTNPLEHNVPNSEADNGLDGAAFVCEHVAAAPYANLYARAWGAAPDCQSAPDLAFKRIAVAVAAWESSPEVNSFSSKRDEALANDNDDTPGASPYAGFSAQENLGKALFFGLTTPLNPTGKSARCSTCHNSRGGGSRGDEPGQLFTDYRYHHLGLPPNFELAHFDAERPDRGLAEHTFPDEPTSGHDGHFKTPTLRNVARRAPGTVRAYMHNGYFKNLADVVHFYNTARSKLDPEKCPPGTTAEQARQRDCWPAPEINNGRQASKGTVMGDLNLTAAEEAALVAFMETLSDQDEVSPPPEP